MIIFKKFNKEIFWGIPLSTKIKTGAYYLQFYANDRIPRVAILSQLRLMDAKRLMNKISVVDIEDYQHIQKAIISLCDS